MVGMRNALLLATCILSLGAASTALAQAIESEPLAPMDLAPAPAGSDTGGYKPEPYYKPVTPAPSSNAPDSGMSGTDGGSSAYDLGVTKGGTSAPPAPAPGPSPERSTGGNNTESYAPRSTIPYGGSIGNAPPAKYSYENKKFCTLKISFGSRGAGVDAKTADKMKSYLDSNADKISYTRVNWGREGEYDYCLDINQHNQRSKVYTALKKMMPVGRTKQSSEGDITITGAGFTTLSTH
jgi:hypothetical protein